MIKPQYWAKAIDPTSFIYWNLKCKNGKLVMNYQSLNDLISELTLTDLEKTQKNFLKEKLGTDREGSLLRWVKHIHDYLKCFLKKKN